MSGQGTFLDVQGLRVCFQGRERPVTVLHDVNLSVDAGETLGVIGESGCGKSTLALAIMRLIKRPSGWIDAGQIHLGGTELTALPEAKMRALRGNELGMIFQEPLTSLNPVYTVGEQISEVLRRHRGLSRKEARDRAVELLKLLQIPDPDKRFDVFPFQLSGGMRQRVMIAIALACGPKLLLADEPTTALDVTVQAQIFDLLRETRPAEAAMLLITHDFGAIAEMADRVVVMYAGHKIEEGPVRDIVSDPRHPYTQGLLRCVPEIDAETRYARGELPEIGGTVPSLAAPPPGCRSRRAAPWRGRTARRCPRKPGSVPAAASPAGARPEARHDRPPA